MRGVLLLNGEPYAGEIDGDGALVYCCDGAYSWAHGKVKIDKNIGDFDSLDYLPEPPPEEVYPSEKDCTDGEIALRKLIAAGAEQIEIYGGGGGREDHFLGNVHLLYYAHAHGVRAQLVTNRSRLFARSGRIEIDAAVGKTISLLPFGGSVHIMDSAGLKYSYPPCIGYGMCRGISNVVAEEGAYVLIGEEEVALIIINEEDV